VAFFGYVVCQRNRTTAHRISPALDAGFAELNAADADAAKVE
jgi:hypothetical protein